MTNPWIVLKFGGNSVADLSCWQTIAKITAQHLQKNLRPLIVCSALSGTTNQLEQLIAAAMNNSYEEILQKIISAHQQLAQALSVDFTLIQNDIAELSRIIMGVSLLKDTSPAVHAKILSWGEILLTKLGGAYLQAQHFPTTWLDARQLLKSIDLPHHHYQSEYLAAKCDYHADPELLQSLQSMATPVGLTQGFIASNSHGETVILGRGGSDTSAAYFAAKLKANRCEIWTDVPGIYSANPHEIPEARLIKSLDYDEAQEIASKGGKVLHPYCIPPLKAAAIPLYVGYTRKPQRPGTNVSVGGRQPDVPFKSILIKYHVTLIQIESVQMWQQVGFLADVFHCFKKHGLSVDLISTSETNVTVSLDLQISGQDHAPVADLLNDLNKFCKATEIGPCAAISIVGCNIRSVLHKIGHALRVFETHKIYLVSQSANDLTFNVVVDEEHALRLAKNLHAFLIEEAIATHAFEQSWYEEFATEKVTTVPWWQHRREELLTLAKKNSPLYVYDRNTLQQSRHALKQLTAIDRIFYAMKANNHPDILNECYQAGLGFECVSLGELNAIFNQFKTIDPGRILFTPNFAPRSEYQEALSRNVLVTIDNLHPLRHWPQLFRNRQIFLRLDPGKGRGHHQHVCTAGHQSKFGIAENDIPELLQLLSDHQIHVMGVHAHMGSGIFEWQFWKETALFLLQSLKQFPQARIINLGGGLGVPEKTIQAPLDLSAFNLGLQELKVLHPGIEFWLEPGRFLVAPAGVLLTTVTQIKQKGAIRFIGVDAGMNSLIRPALYGSYHRIINLTRLNEPSTQFAHIVGPICESGDTLGYGRQMPKTEEGDVLLIANAGAYGYVMSSNYNLRTPANQYFLN